MRKIDYRKFTLSRIKAFIKQIVLIKELDFPYVDSFEALEVILNHIKNQYKSVEESVLESEALKSRCSLATKELFTFHPFNAIGYYVISKTHSSLYDYSSLTYEPARTVSRNS